MSGTWKTMVFTAACVFVLACASAFAGTSWYPLALQLHKRDPAHPATGKLEAVLKADKPGCTETPLKMTGEIWATEMDLRKHGYMYSSLQASQALYRVLGGLPRSAKPTNCGMLLAAWDLLIEDGK